jgi:hypothetical protein
MSLVQWAYNNVARGLFRAYNNVAPLSKNLEYCDQLLYFKPMDSLNLCVDFSMFISGVRYCGCIFYLEELGEGHGLVIEYSENRLGLF